MENTDFVHVYPQSLSSKAKAFQKLGRLYLVCGCPEKYKKLVMHFLLCGTMDSVTELTEEREHG
jgi:hypothetical protein